MVCELKDFPVGRADGQIPVCEINGEVLTSSSDGPLNLHTYTSSVSEHPNVELSRDVLNPSMRKPYEGKVFLPSSDSLIQRLQDAWYEHGMLRVLQILSEEDSINWGKGIAKYCVIAYNSWCSLKKAIIPTSEEKYFLEDYRRLGPVICMAWHPATTKLALGTSDDSVSIYSTHTKITPVLKSKTQRRITDLAWRPFHGGRLAVASADGINLWHVDPNSLVARPSPSTAVLLPHSYVTSIAWSPQGDLLVSCNGVNSNMIIWSVDTKEKLSVAYTGGTALLLWNPTMPKLLAATRNKVFRLWSTESWDCESWTTPGGRVSAGCWSHDGSCLLFSTSALPFIYSLQLGRGLFSGPPSAVIVADITKFTHPLTNQTIGGEIRKLVWDSESRHVAVMFAEGKYIAVYFSSLSATLTLSPGYFIEGLQNEVPTCIAFQTDFSEGGNLTICWSTGRVRYFPMVYQRNVSLPLNQRIIKPNRSF